MKIEQSAVVMSASHTFSSEREVSFDFSSSFRTLFDQLAQTDESAAANTADRQARMLLMLQELIGRMLEFIAGGAAAKVSDVRERSKTDLAAFPEKVDGPPRPARELQWTSRFSERISEHERTAFSSTGQIRTADGKTLDFNLDLTMCRSFECERAVTEQGSAILRDPLVINFAGKACELDGKRFEFDLDADGQKESIPGLAGGSGFLAIDRNGDGHINDGSELFGTRSGDGFADLAGLDADGNHWLDENDAAFDSLRVWRRDESGRERLNTLSEEGVGALYLDATETPFALTDDENRLLAQIRASGLYLRENGSAGTLQQVDLAV